MTNSREKRLMAQRNWELTKEVDLLRPKIKDLEWELSLHKAALAAACSKLQELRGQEND